MSQSPNRLKHDGGLAVAPEIEGPFCPATKTVSHESPHPRLSRDRAQPRQQGGSPASRSMLPRQTACPGAPTQETTSTVAMLNVD